MNYLKKLLGQPKAVILLSFMQMWSCLSYYASCALLTLFMIKALHFSDAFAFGVYGVFCALVELGGVFGAHLADKVLGLRRAIMLGGWIATTGHIFLAFEWFFPGLALVVIGMSLFSINLTVLIGNFYESADEKRINGFTLFYIGMYMGILLGAAPSGFLAEHYGWRFGFGLAALGMCIGNCVLLKFHHLLKEKGERALKIKTSQKFSLGTLLILAVCLALFALRGQHITLPILPWLAAGLLILIFQRLVHLKLLTKNNIVYLGVYILTLVLFFSAEEQIGSSLLVFADRMTNCTLLNIPVTSTIILALNPIVIILCGALASYIHTRLKHPFLHFLIPFLLAGAAFSSLILGRLIFPQIPISMLMGVVGVISFSELMIGPSIYSVCSEITLQAKDPKVLGLVPIGFSLSEALGGSISQFVAQTGYVQGFLYLGILLAVGGTCLGVIHAVFQKKQTELAR